MIHFDAGRGAAITLEYEVELRDLNQEQCWQAQEPNTYYQWDAEECRHFVRHLNALEIENDRGYRVASSKLDEEDDFYMQSPAITAQRVFIKQTEFGVESPESRVQVLWTGGSAPLRQLGSMVSAVP